MHKSFGLPFHDVLAKIADRPEQKTMQDSAQQARNLDGEPAIPSPLPAAVCGQPADLLGPDAESLCAALAEAPAPKLDAHWRPQ